MRSILSAVLFMSAGLIATAHAALVDFNAPAYTGAFTDGTTQPASPVPLHGQNGWTTHNTTSSYQVVNGGLATGQPADRQFVRPSPLFGNSEATAYFGSAFDLATPAPTLYTSVYFQYLQVGSSGGTPMTLGIAGDNATNLFASSTGAGDMILARIDKPGTNDMRLTIQSRLGGTGSTNMQATATFTGATGNWFYLESQFTRMPTPGQFAVSTSLYTAAANGTVGALVPQQQLSTTIMSTSLWNDSSLYVGIRGFASNGLLGFDNFSAAIPEPAALGVLVPMAILGLRRTRAQAGVS